MNTRYPLYYRLPMQGEWNKVGSLTVDEMRDIGMKFGVEKEFSGVYYMVMACELQ